MDRHACQGGPWPAPAALTAVGVRRRASWLTQRFRVAALPHKRALPTNTSTHPQLGSPSRAAAGLAARSAGGAPPRPPVVLPAMTAAAAPLALDSAPHGEAAGRRRGEDAMDALPYADALTPDEQRSAEALIQAEVGG